MLQVDGSEVHGRRRAICNLEMTKSTDPDRKFLCPWASHYDHVERTKI